MSKRWVFPAVYIAAAGIILTLVWVYQGTGDKALNPDSPKESVETGAASNEELLQVGIRKRGSRCKVGKFCVASSISVRNLGREAIL